jgi:hypothetical protein
VEMLIAMVLTLILVFAVAEFYAIVGDAVKDGRATIEMGGQLRAVVQRLKADLDQLTIPVIPWTDEGAASGYFEYFEGRGNDYEPFANFVPGSGPNMATGFSALATLSGVTNGLGDGDDFLAFTIRAAGQPFTGRYQPAGASAPTIINSQLAEVIWWVGFEDRDGDNIWDADEPRQLYRRQLLIRPDLTNIDNNAPYPSLQLAYQRLLQIWQSNDISLHIKPDLLSNAYRIVPNSLADLARREHRFGHMPLLVSTSATMPPYLIDQTFPHSAVSLNPAQFPLLLPSFTANSPGVQPPNPSQRTLVLTGTAMGEDVVLSNLLAFDVQAYDPYARVWPDSLVDPPQAALTPSDPGYRNILATGNPSTFNAGKLIGLGAYVDLNYYRYLPPNAPKNALNDARNIDNTLTTTSGFPMPYYADRPAVPLSLKNTPAEPTYLINFGYNTYPFGATYDTWAFSYEKDGMDQLGTGTYDRATNGLDDDGANGVDDARERETVPPYPQPLRGIRVRIRIYEPGTRQIRQATVEADFLRE